VTPSDWRRHHTAGTLYAGGCTIKPRTDVGLQSANVIAARLVLRGGFDGQSLTTLIWRLLR